MGIEILANKFFDIMVAGGILLLIYSLQSNNSGASGDGWMLIVLAFAGFIFYALIRAGMGRGG